MLFIVTREHDLPTVVAQETGGKNRLFDLETRCFALRARYFCYGKSTQNHVPDRRTRCAGALRGIRAAPLWAQPVFAPLLGAPNG